MRDLPSKSQIDKLGKRLAAAHPQVSGDDLSLLQHYRAAHDPSLNEVVFGLRDLGFDPTPRLKTPTTIIDKLIREKTRLSSVQDVAGARIVVDGTRNGQDVAVRSIESRFGGKILDRRDKPSHGYRAVHVVVTVNGFRVEIQVRTPLQNLWAQIMERVGDRYGRGVRYGELPDDAAERAVVEALISAANAVAHHEYLLARAEDWLTQAAGLDRDVVSQSSELVRLEGEIAAMKTKLDADEVGFRQTLTRMVAALEGGEAS